MWASLPATLISFLLLSAEVEARLDRFHLKHGFKHGNGKDKTRPSKDIDATTYTTVLVTVTVKPMPVGTDNGITYPGTSTIFPTATDVASGIFPPGPSGSGSGVPIGTGTGTGILYPTGGRPSSNQTLSFPVFTRPPVISLPSGTEEFIPTTLPELTSSSVSGSPTLGFPIFTKPPVIDVPAGTDQTSQGPVGTAVNSPSAKNPALTFPLFTGSPVIVIPSGTDKPTLSPSSTDAELPASSPVASSSFPPFTGAPIIDIPTGTEEGTVAPTSTEAQVSTSAIESPTKNPTLTFPPFTGKPVIDIPSATAQAVDSTPVTTSALATTTETPAVGTPLPFLQGVNLGGWLVIEKWMTEDLFTGAFASAKDQYTFDSLPGSLSALEQHWSTFFTEADITSLAKAGFNALRIPIGYWAYDNSNTPYHSGADAFLEDAIVWARNHNMKVLVDCHGSVGSQNGFDNSGQAGEAHWQEPANLEKSLDVLKIMAKKYGSKQYADVVIGLQLVNEPTSWGNNKFDVTKEWTEKAYSAVKAEIENPDLLIVMHDAFQGGVAWESVSSSVASFNTAAGAKADVNPFAVDEHLYQLFTDSYNSLNQDQHIEAACGWSSSLSASTSLQKTIVGEFSAATNICLLSDGTTIPGTSCSEEGCECQTGDWTKWSQGMKDQMRKYVEAQLEAFETSTAGYFAWSAKAPGGWGVLNLLGNGVWPASADDRRFAGVCGGAKREIGSRNMRRGLRR